MRIIPAIDLLNGKCVRLSKGDYHKQAIYSEDPLSVAQAFQDNGIRYLHLVDLDGAKSGSKIHLKTLETITSQTDLIVDYGGGIRTRQDVEDVLNAGAAQVTLGSLAVQNKEETLQILQQFGNDKLILGADAENGFLKSGGWTEKSELELISFIKNFVKSGFKTVICTDISRDGMLAGPSVKTYQDILKKVNLTLIASGGVASIKDVTELQKTGCAGVIIGKALYENKITFKELQPFL